MHLTDSHKVYYGIFISIGISGTCTKMLGDQANWLRLEAVAPASHGRSGTRIFQLDQRGDATLECPMGQLAGLPCCAETEAIWMIVRWPTARIRMRKS